MTQIVRARISRNAIKAPTSHVGPLLTFWRDRPHELSKLSVRQIVNMAGDGRILDDTPCSREFRIFLSEVEAGDLQRFVAECLERETGAIRKGFPDSGFVLQDVVNEIGRRLDFTVVNGVYQGRKGTTGYDGIWQDGSGKSLIVEVKTTDTYSISLDNVERYRQELIAANRIDESSSVLFVVGRDDTGALEAQIRGSRHAWTMRMIGAASLVRLLQVKVVSESPSVVSRIKSLLRPIEYTRVDGIVDLMFDVRADTDEPEPEVDELISTDVVERALTAPTRLASSPPAYGLEAFRQIAADCLSETLANRLTRRRRSLFETADDSVRAVISVSKKYDRDYQSYWYAFYDSQRAYLREAATAYLVLCALDSGRIWAVPSSVAEALIPDMNFTTRQEGQTYWHVLTKMVGDECFLVAGDQEISLHPYETVSKTPAS
ncbi:hypothetical protein [Rhizobium leguminosarum]|uniref:hypothetical protein n=1 Tax=Rhizobium leguminosarum TaxID=384 RepID=UPI003F9DCB64